MVVGWSAPAGRARHALARRAQVRAVRRTSQGDVAAVGSVPLGHAQNGRPRGRCTVRPRGTLAEASRARMPTSPCLPSRPPLRRRRGAPYCCSLDYSDLERQAALTARILRKNDALQPSASTSKPSPMLHKSIEPRLTCEDCQLPSTEAALPQGRRPENFFPRFPPLQRWEPDSNLLWAP